MLNKRAKKHIAMFRKPNILCALLGTQKLCLYDDYPDKSGQVVVKKIGVTLRARCVILCGHCG